MYIFNLVLCCWLTNGNTEGQPSNEFLNPNKDHPHRFATIEELVRHWNAFAAKALWGDEIHCPCIKEHFEVYKKLPKNWNSVKWSCNDKA